MADAERHMSAKRQIVKPWVVESLRESINEFLKTPKACTQNGSRPDPKSPRSEVADSGVTEVIRKDTSTATRRSSTSQPGS
jgi:hypothetical protein